jgi:hypothetical protein
LDEALRKGIRQLMDELFPDEESDGDGVYGSDESEATDGSEAVDGSEATHGSEATDESDAGEVSYRTSVVRFVTFYHARN